MVVSAAAWGGLGVIASASLAKNELSPHPQSLTGGFWEEEFDGRAGLEAYVPSAGSPPALAPLTQVISVIPHLRLIAALADQRVDFSPVRRKPTPVAGHYVFFQHGGPEVVGRISGPPGPPWVPGSPRRPGGGARCPAPSGRWPAFSGTPPRPGSGSCQVRAPGLVGPGDKGGEAAGGVLELPYPEHVFDALRPGLQVAEHHGGAGL